MNVLELCEVTLLIRPLTAPDLPAVNAAFGSEFGRTHSDDLDDQGMDHLTFQVAFLDGRPVGHGLVKWAGARDRETAAAYPGCPEIYRMSVLEACQSRGIGTALLRACESEARERGHALIGLGVDDSNLRARALYLRCGYRATELDKCVDRYRVRGDSGKVEWIESPGAWLVKALLPDCTSC